MNNLPTIVSISSIELKDKDQKDWSGAVVASVEGYYVKFILSDGEERWVFAPKEVVNSHYDWADAQCKVNAKLDWQEVADASIIELSTFKPSKNGLWLEGVVRPKGGQRARRP